MSPDSDLGDVSDPDLQVALERSLLQGRGVPSAPPPPRPPYNPDFLPPGDHTNATTTTVIPSQSSSSSLSSMSHSSSTHVGWRQDLLEANDDDSTPPPPHPLEPEIQDMAVPVSEHSASGSEGMILRQRNQGQARHAREVDTGDSTSTTGGGIGERAPLSLSREEMRAARLQRLGVQQEREKRPLSELSRNSRRKT